MLRPGWRERAAGVPPRTIAATVRPPAAPPSLLSTAMAALCVQAIWMTRAHSISPRGLAPSMNAKLAFTAISQIPLTGNRAAAISCCREAPTNALEGVPTRSSGWLKMKNPAGAGGRRRRIGAASAKATSQHTRALLPLRQRRQLIEV